MFLATRPWVIAGIVAACLVPNVVGAANEGQKELDEATEAKLSARTLTDLGEVIRLCESALAKGLDDDNRQWAEQLLSATRIQRGKLVADTIFNTFPPDANWAQFRRVALEDLEAGVKLDPKQTVALLMIARLNLLPGGDEARAAKALEATIDGSEDDPVTRSTALVLRAGMEDDIEKKLEYLDQAVKTNPNDAAAWRTRGGLLADEKKYDEALKDLRKAAELAPESASTHEAIALVLIDAKRYDEALDSLDRVAKLAPKSAIPLVHKARILALESKNEEAIKVLEQAYALEPANVAVLLMRASVYQEMKQPEKALADVDRALELRPGLPMAMRFRAMLLAGSGKFDLAIGQLEELARSEPDDNETTLQLAFFYSAEKMHSKAIERFDEVLKRDPKNAGALRGRADSLLGLGKHAEAIEDYEKALAIEPDDSGALNNLAWVLSTSPKSEVRNGSRAVELATKACELTKFEAPHILSTLGAAYAETGDFETAKKWSQKAIALAEGEEKETLRKELESYEQQKPVRELMEEDKSQPAATAKAAPKAKGAKKKQDAIGEKPAKPGKKSAKSSAAP